MALCWKGAPSWPIWSRPPSVIRMFSACSSMSASSNTSVPPGNVEIAQRKVALQAENAAHVVRRTPRSSRKLTLNEEHFQHWGASVQEDGLAFSDDGKGALLRWGETAPCEPRRPHVNVKKICIVLKKRKQTEWRRMNSVKITHAARCEGTWPAAGGPSRLTILATPLSAMLTRTLVSWDCRWAPVTQTMVVAVLDETLHTLPAMVTLTSFTSVLQRWIELDEIQWEKGDYGMCCTPMCKTQTNSILQYSWIHFAHENSIVLFFIKILLLACIINSK